MSTREKILEAIANNFPFPYETDGKIRKELAHAALEAVESFIEEDEAVVDPTTPQELNNKDKVRLARELEDGDGSYTDEACGVAHEMSKVPLEDVGEIVDDSHNEEYAVWFPSINETYFFHVDDLVKVEE